MGDVVMPITVIPVKSCLDIQFKSAMRQFEVVLETSAPSKADINN